MTGTVMERVMNALLTWLIAFYLMNASKKGSGPPAPPRLGCQYKTAWFMHHRIMEAMRRRAERRWAAKANRGGRRNLLRRPVDAGAAPRSAQRKTLTPRGARLALPEKRAIVPWSSAAAKFAPSMSPADDKVTVSRIVLENVDRETRLHTDESRLYIEVGTEFADHETVKHTRQGIRRGDGAINFAEGFFAFQARNARRLPALPRSICTGIWPNSTSATITVKRSAKRQGPHASPRQRRGRQAPYLSATSLSRIFQPHRRSGFCGGASAAESQLLSGLAKPLPQDHAEIGHRRRQWLEFRPTELPRALNSMTAPEQSPRRRRRRILLTLTRVLG